MEALVFFLTTEGWSGLERPCDQARRMGFDLVELQAMPSGTGHRVRMTLRGLDERAVETLTRRIAAFVGFYGVEYGSDVRHRGVENVA